MDWEGSHRIGVLRVALFHPFLLGVPNGTIKIPGSSEV